MLYVMVEGGGQTCRPKSLFTSNPITFNDDDESNDYFNLMICPEQIPAI